MKKYVHSCLQVTHSTWFFRPQTFESPLVQRGGPGSIKHDFSSGLCRVDKSGLVVIVVEGAGTGGCSVYRTPQRAELDNCLDVSQICGQHLCGVLLQYVACAYLRPACD